MIPEKMKAVAVVEPGKAEVIEVSTPVPAPGEVLIRVRKCLLCTWEQRIFRDGSGMTLPYIPGHELSGEICAIPEGTLTSFKVGDKVVAKTLSSCGHCEFCYRGDDNNCTGAAKKLSYDGIGAAGGLAQYLSMPVSRVYLLDNQDIDFETAAFAEPVACCLRSMERAALEFSEDVVIVGAGIMGQLHNLLVKKSGCRSLVVDLDEARLEMAKRQGADEVINPNDCDPVERIKELTNGHGAHVIFFTLSVPSLAEAYLQALNKLGRMVYYGSFRPKDPIKINPDRIHYTEQTITGSYSPTSKGFWMAQRLLSYGLIDVKPLLSVMYPMEEANTAFEQAMSPKTYRVGIDLG